MYSFNYSYKPDSMYVFKEFMVRGYRGEWTMPYNAVVFSGDYGGVDNQFSEPRLRVLAVTVDEEGNIDTTQQRAILGTIVPSEFSFLLAEEFVLDMILVSNGYEVN